VSAVARLLAAVRGPAFRAVVVEAGDVRRVVEDLDSHRTRADAAEEECARLRECLSRANVSLEATERARYAAEDERDAVLELVATDAVEVARLRDERGAALATVAVVRVALDDARRLAGCWREQQLTAALEAVAAERARCAAVCREVAARYRSGACGCAECEGRGDGARECAEAIERGAVGR
jgi:hypothetical protein